MAIKMFEVPVAFRQSVSDAIKKDEDGWWERTEYCSRRLLSAVMFRESSELTVVQTRCTQLPIIGYYYSVFHVLLAALYLDPSTTPEDLKRIGHGRLRKLVDDRLVGPTVLDSGVISVLDRMRKLREFANYRVGGRMPEDDLIFENPAEGLYQSTGEVFDAVFGFVGQLDGQLVDGVRQMVGDGIGDDVLGLYLDRSSRERVSDFFMTKNLTN